MKKIVLILPCILLICSCNANPPYLLSQASSVKQSSSLSQTPSQNQTDGLFSWDGFCDLSGEKIDFSGSDIKGLDVNYIVGWNQDTSGYKKIRRGDKVGGYDVIEVAANYYIQYKKDQPPTVICNRNDYWVELGDALPGVLVVNQEGISFFAYFNDQKENFLFICERNGKSEREFSDQSIINVDGNKQVHVQPIRISSEILADSLFIKAISTMLIGKMSDDPAILATLTEPVYLDAEITFESINFFPFSDGEGAGIYGTRAVGFIEDIDKIEVKSKL